MDNSLENEYQIISLASLAGFELEKLNLENAEKFINRGLELNPNDANFYFTAAQIYFKNSKFDSALKSINQAFELNQSADISKRISIKVDSYKIIFLGIEISLASNNGGYFNYFCKLLDKTNKEKSKTLNINESEILKSLINLRTAKQSMIDSLNEYISLRSLSTYLNLLELAANPQLTANVLERIKTKFYNNDLFHQSLGNAYMALGKNKQGEENLLRALKVNPQNPSVYFFLISFYLNEGKFNKVNELLVKAELVFESNKMIQSKFDHLKEKVKCLTA